MKKAGKEIGVTAGVFLAVVLLGFVIMCAVYCLPAGRCAIHVRQSGQVMVQGEDEYYRPMIVGKNSTILDNFTDTLMLLTAGYVGGEGVIDKAMNNYRISMKDGTLIESCQICGLDLETKNLKKTAYARYWHGYLAVLKPFLLFFNLNEIRDLNVVFVTAGISAVMILLYRRGKQKYLLPLLLAFGFMNPATIAMSLQFSTIFYTIVASLIVLLLFSGKPWFEKYFWIYFMVVGMVASFVDLLTYPVAAFGFPLFVYFALHEDTGLKEGVLKFAGASVSLGGGYIGMWASKWVLSSVLMQKNYFERAFEQIKARSGNVVEGESVTAGQVQERIWEFLRGNPVRILILLMILGTAVLAVLTGIQRRRVAASLLMLCIGLFPFAWYLVTQNHTYIHFYFTYRGLGVFVAATSGFLMPLVDEARLRKRRERDTGGR